MPQTAHLELEAAIGRAHRSLWAAALLADRIGQQQLCFELEEMKNELGQMQEELLRGRRWRKDT